MVWRGGGVGVLDGEGVEVGCVDGFDGMVEAVSVYELAGDSVDVGILCEVSESDLWMWVVGVEL